MFFSREVIFHEEFFPFHSVTPQDTLVDPFPHVVLHIPANDFPSSSTSDVQVPFAFEPSQSPLINPPHRSTRPTKPPSYLRDFHCNLSTHQRDSNTSHILYRLSHGLSYDALFLFHKNFIMVVSPNYEP